MPPKKPGLSLEQHDKLGKELQNMNNKLTEILVELSKVYPVKTNITGTIDKTIKQLRAVRDDLANFAISEHGSIGDKIYFRSGLEK